MSIKVQFWLILAQALRDMHNIEAIDLALEMVAEYVYLSRKIIVIIPTA